MKRLATIIGAAIVIGGGGITAFWYMNQGTIREQIENALAELNRRGVEMTHDGFEVTGFPFAYGGAFKNLVARSPARNVMLEFPEATARITASAIDTVEFLLPPEFVVSSLDATGAKAEETVRVLSQNLIGTVSLSGDNSYDIGMRADELSAEAPTGDNRMTFRNLETTGLLSVDQASERGRIEVGFEADAMTVTSTPSGALEGQVISVNASDLTGGMQGDLTELAVKAVAASFGVQSDEAVDVAIGGLEFSVAIKPKDEFQDFFSSAKNMNDAMDAIGRMAASSMLNGGAFDADLKFASITADIAGLPDDETHAVSLRSENFAYGWDVNPSLLGVSLSADNFKLDTQGHGAVEYDMDDVLISVKGESPNGYDLAPIALGDSGEEAFQYLIDLLRHDIAAGGSAELTFEASRTDSFTKLIIPEVPFESIKSTVGPSKSVIRLTADQATLESIGETISYEVVGMVSGGLSLEKFVLEGDFPMKAGPDPQAASLTYDMDTIKLSDALWAQLDPNGAMNHDIRGLRMLMDLEMVVLQDILSMDPTAPAPPVDVRRLQLREGVLDLMGFRGEASGEVAMSPPPPAGVFTIDLHNWRAFFESFSATPLGQDPQTQTFLLIASGWLDQFGAPGDTPESTKLVIEISESGATVNGQPFGDPPPGQ